MKTVQFIIDGGCNIPSAFTSNIKIEQLKAPKLSSGDYILTMEQADVSFVITTANDYYDSALVAKEVIGNKYPEKEIVIVALNTSDAGVTRLFVNAVRLMEDSESAKFVGIIIGELAKVQHTLSSDSLGIVSMVQQMISIINEEDLDNRTVLISCPSIDATIENIKSEVISQCPTVERVYVAEHGLHTASQNVCVAF